MAPCSYERESGILKQKSAGWSTYLAKDPCTGGVAKNFTLGSRLYRPCLHQAWLLLCHLTKANVNGTSGLCANAVVTDCT